MYIELKCKNCETSIRATSDDLFSLVLSAMIQTNKHAVPMKHYQYEVTNSPEISVRLDESGLGVSIIAEYLE
jgi:hypothetical protein